MKNKPQSIHIVLPAAVVLIIGGAWLTVVLCMNCTTAKIQTASLLKEKAKLVQDLASVSEDIKSLETAIEREVSPGRLPHWKGAEKQKLRPIVRATDIYPPLPSQTVATTGTNGVAAAQR
jgi:hypothetical protein